MQMNPDCPKDSGRSFAYRLVLRCFFQEATSCTPLMSAPQPS
jgi:hypothetical protein